MVDPSRRFALLTLHAKLGCWLQLGGHCDGIHDPFFVAWKEAYEESGLKSIEPVGDGIFDLGIHRIPEYKGVPEHFHYDARYLFVADPADPLGITDESIDLKWIEIDRFEDYVDGRSLIDMRTKLRVLGSCGLP